MHLPSFNSARDARASRLVVRFVPLRRMVSLGLVAALTTPAFAPAVAFAQGSTAQGKPAGAGSAGAGSVAPGSVAPGSVAPGSGAPGSGKGAAPGQGAAPKAAVPPAATGKAVPAKPGAKATQGAASGAPTAPTAPSPGTPSPSAPNKAGPTPPGSTTPGTDAAAADAANANPEPEQPVAPAIRIPPSEAERAEGLPILRIDVSGNRRVSREDVTTYLREKEKQLFKIENLSNDVRALWDSGFFEDIEVDLQRTDAGVNLRFLVRERPNVRAIEFEGNDELDAEKLTEASEVKANTILSVPAVRRSVQKIKDAYAEKGYFLAEVEFTIVPQKDNEVVVKFKVTEHAQVSVRRVTFIGNDHVPDGELREVMQTGQQSLFSFGSGGPFRQDAFERDVLMLNALYYDKGYLNVQIGTPRVMLTPDREGIEVVVLIHEGPRFKIRQLKIYERTEDGREIEPLGGRRALRTLLRARSGEFFNRAELIKDLQAVQRLYRDAGYASVQAEPEWDIDPVKQEVDIVIPIKRGPLVHVERIEFKGNTKTRESVLRRELEIAEGELFSETKLEDSKRRIQALGYFERVDMSTEQGSQPDRITVFFEVGERPTGTFQVGAGFSSIESFIATAQIQQANLFGNGQSLALQAQISGLRQLITIRFFEPYFLGSDWNFATELYDQLYVYPDFSRRTTGGNFTFGYALVQPWLRVSLTATVQGDSVDTTATSTFVGFNTNPNLVNFFPRLPLANLFNAGRTISLRPGITYDTRDNRLFPTSGIYLNASTEIASQYLGSELQFFRHRFTGRFYYNLGGATGAPGSGFVLKANTELGLITSPSEAGVPIYTRFFLGGILDMRGYRLRTLGTRLPLNRDLDPNSAPATNGSVIGGNLQAYANLEFEFPIIDKVGIRGVTFFDVGNTWNVESQYCNTAPAPQFSPLVSPCFDRAFPNMRLATGLGIRWFSPLGPLRFEWGFPLNKLPYEESNVFEFTIGNFF